jgi:ElaB/YqjD/DUF883 family membrane-anchored ribosome-binding protein
MADATIEDAPTSAAAEELGSIRDDLAALKRDVANLLSHLSRTAAETTTGATHRAEDLAGQLGNEAKRIADNLADQGDRSVKAALHYVETQPVYSLAGAFILGILAGRALTR